MRVGINENDCALELEFKFHVCFCASGSLYAELARYLTVDLLQLLNLLLQVFACFFLFVQALLQVLDIGL